MRLGLIGALLDMEMMSIYTPYTESESAVLGLLIPRILIEACRFGTSADLVRTWSDSILEEVIAGHWTLGWTLEISASSPGDASFLTPHGIARDSL